MRGSEKDEDDRTAASGAKEPEEPTKAESEFLEAILQRSVHLQEIDHDLFLSSSEDLWRPPRGRGVFGGQTIALSIHAALKTCTKPELHVHSLHGYFLLAGDAERNLVLSVKKIRDGSSFATRDVEARQRGATIFQALVQFHKAEASRGMEFAHPMPVVPAPENLRSERALHEEALLNVKVPQDMRDEIKKILEQPARVDMRVVRSKEESKEPVRRYWLRCLGRLSDEPNVHLSCLAYMSDMGLLSAAMMPWGEVHRLRPSMMVSLDHSMWFHSRNFRADEWLLFDTECTHAGSARVLVNCKVYTRSGKLILSIAQEGLIRLSHDVTPPAALQPRASL